MPETSGGEKTLPASERKKQRARERGNVARSQDLGAAWTLTVALVFLTYGGTAIFTELISAMGYYLGELSSIEVTENSFRMVTVGALYRTARMCLPFMVIMMAGGVAINLLQVGFLVTGEPLKPKLDKLNPISGLQKFANVRTLVEFVKSLLKLSVVGFIVLHALRARWGQVMVLPYLTPLSATQSIAGIIFVVWFRAVIAMLVIGLFDYAFQWWKRNEDLKMTVQEAREEAKELEGDPQIRRRIREIQRRMAYQRMMREVPAADVVITNPVRCAVALRYDAANMDAPVVVAKGMRLVAARIREIAVENQVPIVEKPELARLLHRTVDLGKPVPEKLFVAVAEILAFVYRIDRRPEKTREREAFAASREATPAGPEERSAAFA